MEISCDSVSQKARRWFLVNVIKINNLETYHWGAFLHESHLIFPRYSLFTLFPLAHLFVLKAALNVLSALAEGQCFTCRE